MMRLLRISGPLAVALLLLGSSVGCNDDENDVTGSGGSLATLNVDAPSSARSGEDFNVEINAVNVGVSNIRNGHVTVTFDAPLVARSVEASPGTTATVSGNSVIWDLGTLDSNTRSHIDVRVVGMLASGEASRSATIRAQLTAQGISAGDAVASDTVTIMP
jgi:hypothetical protein